jgi:hypothetical protein
MTTAARSAEAIMDCVGTLSAAVEVLRPAFTSPGFRNGIVLFAGWVLTSGPHAVTQALVVTDVARRLHHERFHRFFSRGTWDPDHLGWLLFNRLVRLCPPEGPLWAAVDDTLASKKGAEIFGIGSHLDAVRSTKLRKVFSFGHVWVVLAIVINVPFSRRPWAVPVLLRLYRTKKECQENGGVHRKKTELAREMVEILNSWAGGWPIELVMDSAYSNSTVLARRPHGCSVIGAMRPDAALYAPPEAATRSKRGGRPRVRGRRLPTPSELAADPNTPWQSITLNIYRESRTIYYKTITALWYRACGSELVRVVVVRVDSGTMPIRVFFAANPNLNVKDLLVGYARRWAIEVCFRDLKQHLGFGDSSARKREAVERTAPFVAYIYTVLVMWFAEGAHESHLAIPPIRPWYKKKQGLCFADILRAAQRALITIDVLDPHRNIEDLHKQAHAPLPIASNRAPPGAQCLQ